MSDLADWIGGFSDRRPRSRSRHSLRRSRPAIEYLDVRIVPTGGVTAAYSVTNDWGSGYQAQITINNPQTTAITNWKLQFTLPSTITSIWDSQVASHSGSNYTISGLSWDTAIPAGGSVTFGYVVGSGKSAVAPTNYVLNGVALGSNTPPVTPTMSIASATDTVTASGATSLVFTVSLSQATTGAVTVPYSTANGTAVAGVDYTATSGTLTFAPGATQQTITVPVASVTQSGLANKTVLLNLANPSGATLSQSQATGTIVDKVAPPVVPAISIASATDTVTASGATSLVFTVSLSQATTGTVTVPYSTANGTAVAGVDYTATSGTLTFAPGVTQQTITVPVASVTQSGLANKTVLLNLATPTGATLSQSQATGTIVDKVAPPVVPAMSIASATDAVSSSGGTTMAFTVTLSQATTGTVTVNYTTANGTAVAGTDYTAVSGTLTFAPGVTTQTITVPVSGISQPGMPNKTLLLNLTTPAGATLAQTQATGTIVDQLPSGSTGNVQYSDTNDWGNGFNGQITITNPATTDLNNWTLTFNFPLQITDIWDAKIVSHTGNQYVVSGVGWNNTIAAGTTASFGFTASPGGAVAKAGPTNFVLQGTSSAGGGGSTGGGSTQNPTAVNATAWTYTNQGVAINVLANDTDPNNNPLTVSSVTQGADGTVVINTDGTLTYTPKTGFTGSDAFNYTISNGHGGTASASVSVNVVATPTGQWPSQFVAPYVDMGLYPTYNLTSAMQTAGVKYFSLGFITADSANQASWGGYTEYAINGSAFDVAMQQQIAAVRSMGGDVMPSFGGEAGQELAQVITSVPALTSAYQSVINTYNLTHIDFDIEGAAQSDLASVDRRSQAIAVLQQQAAAAGKTLDVWFTLPVLPTGLTNDGLNVLKSAIKYGVHISGVNVMTMDFGDDTAPQPAGQMGTYTIDAANATFGQLQGLYGNTYSSAQLWSMIGVTPMIGMNDQTDEVFTPQDAVQVATFAERVGMGRISFWSLNRDQQSPSGALTYVSNTASSVLQSPFEFSKDFLAFEN